MEQPIKHRPKSAPVITNAYVQNKREDECLGVKLDSIHYQHHADLIRLRQAVGHIVRQKTNLLTQRAITPQSTLEHVMGEIQTYKKAKHCSVLTKSHLPASTELYVENGMSSKWPPSPFSQSLPSGSHNLYNHRKDKTFSLVTDGRTFPVMEDTKMKPTDSALKHLETSEKQGRKPRATSSLQRKSESSMDLLTYKKLSEIACLESISMREAQRRKQQVQMEKQQLDKSFDGALQERVHNFLKKFE